MRKRCWIALAIVIAAMTACSDATAPNTTPTASGAYALQSINGLAMPVPLLTILFTQYRLEYSTGTITLTNDSSFHEQAIITETIDQKVTRVDTADFYGKWRQADAAVRLLYSDGTDVTGTYKDKVLAFDIHAQDANGQDSVYHYLYKKN